MTTAARVRRFSRNELAVIANQVIGERLPNMPEQGIREASALQNYVLGTRMLDSRGLELYRYGLAGAGICTLGLLHQSPVPTAGEVNLVPLANYAIGTRIIGLTTGAAVAANEYAGGWLYVDTATGMGDCLRILSHPANAGAAACLFTCLDVTTILFDATTRCALVANPYADVIVHPAPPTAHLVGIPRITIPALEYGWFQRRGPAAALIGTAAPAVNSLVSAGLLVNGAVDIYIAGTALGIVGEVMRTDAATDTGMINLMLE